MIIVYQVLNKITTVFKITKMTACSTPVLVANRVLHEQS